MELAETLISMLTRVDLPATTHTRTTVMPTSTLSVATQPIQVLPKDKSRLTRRRDLALKGITLSKVRSASALPRPETVSTCYGHLRSGKLNVFPCPRSAVSSDLKMSKRGQAASSDRPRTSRHCPAEMDRNLVYLQMQ